MPALVDTTIRLLGQEPLAGMMPTADQLRLAGILDSAGFAYLEVSGGGCFDWAVKRGVESPWERIRALRARPHLIHNRFAQNAPTLAIFASREVMDLLARNVFNGVIWPDFGTITSPMSGKPIVQYRPLSAGKKVTFGDLTLTAIPVDHQIPASGVIVEMNGQAITFTGDTGPTQEIWKRTNKTPNVVAIVTEASFPNDQQTLADETAHLSPQTFGGELKKILVDAPVYASHRKIPFERDIESQIKNLRDRRARVLLEKNYTL